ncbi:MAG: hypothetical protein IIA92_07615 [Chloroflexi bacterium]|nr:hypothetical protein [Chloroflexota bacterium]
MRTKTPIRPRPRRFAPKLRAHDSNTSTVRNTVLTPTNGKRIRIIRVRGIQEQADGRHLYELYFGTGANITVNPEKAIDTLDILDLNDDSTRTYERGEGPRGLRNEVLSGRWKTATTTVHKIMVEYDEES